MVPPKKTTKKDKSKVSRKSTKLTKKSTKISKKIVDKSKKSTKSSKKTIEKRKIKPEIKKETPKITQKTLSDKEVTISKSKKITSKSNKITSKSKKITTSKSIKSTNILPESSKISKNNSETKVITAEESKTANPILEKPSITNRILQDDKKPDRSSKKVSASKLENKIKERSDSSPSTNKELKALFSELDELLSKKKSKELESKKFDLQRRSLENEITDYRIQLERYNIETEMANKCLKPDTRKKNQVKQKYQELKNEIETLKKDLEKYQNREKLNQKKLKQINHQYDKYKKEIESSEEEYMQSKIEIDGVLSVLAILMQDIDNSISEVKFEIHNASITSFNSSIVDFRSLIEDLVDFIDGVKNISKGSPTKIAEELKGSMEMVDLLTDGIGDAINLMVTKMKEVNELAVHESTAKFDGMIRDFIEIFENISVLLNRLTHSRASELRDEMATITKELNECTMISITNTNETAILSSQISIKTERAKELKQTFTELVNTIKNNTELVEKRTNIIEEKNNLTEIANSKIIEIRAKQKENNEYFTNFWVKQKEILSKISILMNQK